MLVTKREKSRRGRSSTSKQTNKLLPVIASQHIYTQTLNIFNKLLCLSGSMKVLNAELGCNKSDSIVGSFLGKVLLNVYYIKLLA